MPYCYVSSAYWFVSRFILLICLLVGLSSVHLLAQTVRYVKPIASGLSNGSSWNNASPDLQAMINASASGDQVWVASGTYKPTATTDRSISFAMKNGVAIYGGFLGAETNLSQRPAINTTTPSSTTLSGDIGTIGDNSDNSLHVIRNPPGLTTSAILDGFIITSGNANGSITLGPPDNIGGGMLNIGKGAGQVCSPLIRQCVFVANQAGFGGAMHNDGQEGGSSSPVLINCVFLNNTVTNNGGAMINSCDMYSSSRPLLTNCVFQNNTATHHGGAMLNAGTSNPRLTNCSFLSNTAGYSGGAIYGNGDSQLINCVLWNNGGAFTFFNNGTEAAATVSYSLFDASVTYYTSGPGNLTTTNSPFVSGTDTRLAADSPAINTGDPATTSTTGDLTAVSNFDLAGNSRFLGGRIDMGAYEFSTRLYVRASASGANTGQNWTDAFPDLQTALTYSGNQNEIWVAAGTYKPTSTIDRTISFSMKNGVTIFGGFAGTETTLSQRPTIDNTTPSSTTLSGEIGSPSSTTDNSYHVINNPAGLNITAILDGFVITGGNANNNFSDYSGGGMYNNGSGSGQVCSPLIRQCSFVANQAAFGGAVFNNGSLSGNSSPVLTNCVFQSNSAPSAGGALCNLGQGGISNPTLTNCAFQDNTSTQGGAMWNSGYASGICNPQLTNCSFQGNTATRVGGALYNDNSSPVLNNCVFQSNTANGGGALYNNAFMGNSNPLLTNCSFQNNTAQSGGAMINDGDDGPDGTSSPRLTNCSFQANMATVKGGVMYNVGAVGTTRSSPVLINCVVFNNGGANTIVNNNASLTTSYSLFDTSVNGYTSGPGNLIVTTSPFASTTSTQLAPTAHAINTGDPNTTTATVGTTDPAGTPRFAQGRIDMGAFEWGTTCQGLVTSIRAGNWNDPTVWACNVVPISTDIVQLNHVVTLPTSYVAPIKTLRNSNTGKVMYQSGAKVRLGF
ncbi:hypothetical protein IC229_31515 [Spirosoma sp. BT702]|uniref:Uncharacterized protein n=1 Tax=Spirosoma profusum TaxID=2771354 RepID=A0A927AVI0_9BACT|nr:choice-of-anchor Q domain-containing protein [Spirosoma profusum]MBD2705193.1 hypothetical protein [Spirosoma profusum]